MTKSIEVRAWRVALGAVAAAVVLSACGADNSLGGSVSELFPLEISRVEVLRNEEAFQVSYYRNRGADVDLVLRLSVALEGVQLSPGKKIDLVGEYAPGHRRATVIHIAGGEPARILPPVKQGDLVITSGGEPDQDTRGNFSVSFEQSGDYGAGRTAYGSFAALARDAGFDPEPRP